MISLKKLARSEGFDPAESFERPPTIYCMEHHEAERWVVCIHDALINSARFVEGEPLIVGDALCPGCRVEVDSHRPVEAHYRFACGVCVRDRWPLENAS